MSDMTTNTTTAPELLPCPFCGGMAQVKSQHGDAGKSHWCECLNCRAGGQDMPARAAAITAWNQRAPVAQDAEPVAWMVECTDQCNGCYGSKRRRRRIVDAAIYDASSDEFWISSSAKAEHRITPLYAPQPSDDWKDIGTAPRDGTWFWARIDCDSTPRWVRFADKFDHFPISFQGECWSRAPTQWKRGRPTSDEAATLRAENERLTSECKRIRNEAVTMLNECERNYDSTINKLIDRHANTIATLRTQLAEAEKRAADRLERLMEAEHNFHVESAAMAGLLEKAEDHADMLAEALRKGEAALSDIGDADREDGDDIAWCEARAAKAIPAVRAALAAHKLKGEE